MGGLQRFLFLVIDAYSSAASTASSKDDATRARAVASGMLSGIIKGYGRIRLAEVRGWDLLREYPTQWAHVMAFITSADLQALSQRPIRLRSTVTELVVPLQLAIDRPFARSSSHTAISTGWEIRSALRVSRRPSHLHALWANDRARGPLCSASPQSELSLIHDGAR